jgi:pyrimidine-nucleoside phosphorylase
MNPVWIIQKKRDRGELSSAEIGHFIAGYAQGDIPDYQMSALAMAIYLNGMTTAEIAALTDHMLASGDTFNWPDDGTPRVDKHSTGGIGDKTSLILAPMLACCGLQVPMISGRGLGATGGTLDKLEAIPGFRTNLSMDEVQDVVQRVGCVITGATATLVPADRKLYALRDVTATVPSIPLITASIMSKKLAEGLDALVLDVKFGTGAFMKTADLARQLAESMVATGKRMNVATTALLTDMNQPLGRMAGNAVEVQESIDALEGRGPADLMEVTLALAAELLASRRLGARTHQAPPPSKVEEGPRRRGARGGIPDDSALADAGRLGARTHLSASPSNDPRVEKVGAKHPAYDLAAAREELERTIASGAAREKFDEMIIAQGGDPRAKLTIAPASDLPAPRAGYLASIDAEKLGQAVIAMGGGRQQLGDKLDHSTGFEMQTRLGDKLEPGQPLLRLFAKPDVAARVRQMLLEAIHLADDPPPAVPLILDRIA